jgi:antitoxin PrlF
VESKRAVMAKTPDFLDLAGAVSVPDGKRGTSWDEVLRQTRRARAEPRR